MAVRFAASVSIVIVTIVMTYALADTGHHLPAVGVTGIGLGGLLVWLRYTK